MKKYLISGVSTLVFAGIWFYWKLPALNIKSEGFWFFIISLCIFFGIVEGPLSLADNGETKRKKKVEVITFPRSNKKGYDIDFSFWGGTLKCWGIRVALALFILMLGISFFAGSKLFHARAYSNLITTTEADISVIPSVEGTSSIALMDTKSAAKLGDREIGALSEVVSQYDVANYTQIDFQGKPVKTAPLKYAGFFKWIKNKDNGVPGYVMVDPVDMDADYKALNEGMKYVPSAYFNDNLKRHVRFAYPTDMITNGHFEIDEEGNPWYVYSILDHEIGLFGGDQIVGAIIVNPVNGDMQKLSLNEVPNWVDVVFNGNLICEQYNYSAQLQGGYWNSVFGQAGCKKVTESGDEETTSDFGYVAKDGDIWIYTGVTSVNSDSSNIGFILSNERTKETFFIPCAGADEFSAMAAAEGEVQEKGYVASFPSLILLDENPTYIMVLKDNSGLVKMYACVNVEQYNIVATATSQEDCIEKYKAIMSGKISVEDANSDDVAVNSDVTTDELMDYDHATDVTISVIKKEVIVENGDSYIYIVDENNSIYKAKYADEINMLLVNIGDEITIKTDGTYFELLQ